MPPHELLGGIIVPGAIVMIATILAIYWGSQWHRRNPSLQSFTWGYFQALLLTTALPVAGILILGSLLSDSGIPTADFPLFLSLITTGLIGLKMIKRRRWAWVIGTVLSGPIALILFQTSPVVLLFWIVNSFYSWHRWSEFSSPNQQLDLTSRSSMNDETDDELSQHFSLTISPGFPDAQGIVRFANGQEFTIQLSNTSPHYCDVHLTINGYSAISLGLGMG
jgi:hypothetical protein